MEYSLKEHFYLHDISSSSIDIDDMCLNLDKSVLLAKLNVPVSHKKIADKYNTLFDVCHFQIVQPRISNVDVALLNKYSFDTLENTTITAMNNQIAKLKDWAISTDDKLREEADEILNIRIKELKFMLSTNYVALSNEINKGYKALQLYIRNISSFYSVK